MDFYNWTEGAGATDNFKTANNATIEGIIFGETKALSYEYEKLLMVNLLVIQMVG